MQMTLGSTTESPLSVGNYTFTFTDTATLTVGQRAITVTIATRRISCTARTPSLIRS